MRFLLGKLFKAFIYFIVTWMTVYFNSHPKIK